MKSRALRVVITLGLIVGLSSLLGAQLQLGSTNMTVSRASTLTMPISVSRGVAMRSFAMRVGGVAFDRVARPATGLTVQSLDLRYDPSAEDGQRLVVSMNGVTSRPFIPDWQLIPIARVAHSGNSSLVTLFGNMPTAERAAAVREKGGRIVNYHRDLEDTLLGLRTLQLDMLIFNPDSVHLPTIGTGAERRYLLGLGERRPTPTSGMTAFQKVNALIADAGYQSYIVSDYQRDLTFSMTDGAFTMTGTPYFYFWRTRGGSADFEQNGRESILDAMKQEFAADAAAGKAASLSAWCGDKIVQVQGTKDFADLLGMPRPPFVRLTPAELGSMSQKERCQRLFEMQYRLEATRIEHLQPLSDSFSARPAEIAAINPAVWQSAVRTMQYGAFFRYHRKTNPAGWERFVTSVGAVTPAPIVQTPGEVYLPGERRPETAAR
jgi:hypothetical protein